MAGLLVRHRRNTYSNNCSLQSTLLSSLPQHHAGISMHKGYAFVQFANPFDARSSCLGEDGRTICGQVIGKIRAGTKSETLVVRPLEQSSEAMQSFLPCFFYFYIL